MYSWWSSICKCTTSSYIWHSAVSGAATFLYVGSPAVASVNYNSSATPNLRSVNLVNAGSGYSSSPSIVFSANGGTVTTAAVATATYFQSIAYFTNSQSQTSGAATVNGTININSNQNATSFSGVGSIFTTNGGVNYTDSTNSWFFWTNSH
jgi:hypothetical protein